MAHISEIIDNLENKIHDMFLMIRNLEDENRILNQDLMDSKIGFQNQLVEIENLKKKCDALKSVNSFLGSEENKKETKLKINSLIREIDYCIVQLSE